MTTVRCGQQESGGISAEQTVSEAYSGAVCNASSPTPRQAVRNDDKRF
jgi:hypothetical protein